MAGMDIRPDEVDRLAGQMRDLAAKAVPPIQFAQVGPEAPADLAGSIALHKGMSQALVGWTDFLGGVRDTLVFNSEYMHNASVLFPAADHQTSDQFAPLLRQAEDSVPRRAN